jgi:hypothetical protein
MRILLFCSLLIPLMGMSQSKYALIDKNYKIPILYTDSVSVEQIKKGFFPFENKSIDTLIANLYYLRDMLLIRQRAKMKSFELRSGSSVFKISRVPYAYGDRYEVIVESTCGEVLGKLKLINHENKNKKSAELLGKLIAYLKENKSFFKEPNEVYPKLYNVEVISE